MNEERRIDPKHQKTRGALRVIGPIILVVGIILTVIGIGSFFVSMNSAMSSFGATSGPKYFWCAFLGMPLVVVGLAITSYGYMGAVARYSAAEIAPVGKDTINYMADGTKGGIKTVARAVGEGISAGLAAGAAGGSAQTTVQCPRCETDNDADARFCDNCGAELTTSRECSQCGEQNDPDARFCDNCGTRLG